METRELILLGILKAQSQHGYQINEFIENNLSNVTDMKKATAYHMLDKLHQKGFVDVEIEQEGNRPPRKVYSINEKGSDYFLNLLRSALTSTGNNVIPLDVGLMFIDYISNEEAIKYLNERIQALKKLVESPHLVAGHGHILGVTLSSHYHSHMIQSEYEWVLKIIEQLQSDAVI